MISQKNYVIRSYQMRDEEIRELLESASEDCAVAIAANGRGWWENTKVKIDQALALLSQPAEKSEPKLIEAQNVLMKWLMSDHTGERVTFEEMHKVKKELDRLAGEKERLKKALEYYANKNNYFGYNRLRLIWNATDDEEIIMRVVAEDRCGERARQALQKGDEDVCKVLCKM